MIGKMVSEGGMIQISGKEIKCIRNRANRLQPELLTERRKKCQSPRSATTNLAAKRAEAERKPTTKNKQVVKHTI